MKLLSFVATAIFSFSSVSQSSWGLPQLSVRIAGGDYQPIFRVEESQKQRVSPFYLDRLPVSVGEYRRFLASTPEWRRSNRNQLMTDSGYLQSWVNDETPVTQNEEVPVTEVSWFAARAFCRDQGKRLPTTAEWEFVALASEKSPDGRDDHDHLERILRWYSSPNRGELPARGRWKNAYGVYDVHGLVWEWVSDFNNELTTGESRGDSEEERNLFCGAGALAVNEKSRRDYAAFMRYGFRGSLQGSYSTAMLGFRCASDRGS